MFVMARYFNDELFCDGMELLLRSLKDEDAFDREILSIQAFDVVWEYM